MPHVILFFKAPEIGLVKTRLAASVGHDMALKLYCEFLKTTTRRLAAYAPLHIACTPMEKAHLLTPHLQAPHTIAPQRGRDLGERMKHALEEAFRAGHTKAIITGGDIPDLPLSRIDDAFSALDTHDVVFVPTSDGGYCLVGAREGHDLSSIFHDIPWSQPHLMEETLRRAQAHGIHATTLEPWHDIDTADDFLEFVARNKKSIEFPELFLDAASEIGGDFS